MEPIQVEAILESFNILVDTREQPSKRATQRYESFRCPYRRQKLEYGDYTYNFRISDVEMWKPSDKVIPGVVIERKMGLEELSACFTHDRRRFEAEMELAKSHRASVYLLIENATWEKIITGHYKTQFNPNAFIASLTAWQARYHLQVVFCSERLSGRLIKEILYRELKERLEYGG